MRKWRKGRAQSRGVESDVIMSRVALMEIARTNPQSSDELGQLESVGPWRCATYGDEILQVLKKASRN